MIRYFADCWLYYSNLASDQKNYDARDISRVKSDDYFVVQFINAKEGNVDKAHKTMVWGLVNILHVIYTYT
jgi:hypothetical protein